MSDNPFAKYRAPTAGDNPFARYRPADLNELPPERAETSTASALWEGLQHGLGNIAMGAGRLGAKALWSPEQNADLDKVAQFREQHFQGQPTSQQHPIATGIGGVAGEMAATAPLAVPTAANLWGRLVQGGAAGALGGAVGGAAAAPGGKEFAPAVGRAAALGGAVGAPLGAAGAFVENPMLARSQMRDAGGLPGNVQGFPRPPPPGPPMGPAARQPLALPPPTVQVPGAPAVQTGQTPGQFDRMALGLMNAQAGDPVMRSALERPQRPGFIPPGPGGTMTSPAATPGPTRPASRMTMDVEEPLPAQSSTLGTAIGENKPQDVDAYITSRFRRAVKPGTSTARNAPDLAMQDQRIMTVVDQILANRRNMQLFDDSGRQVPYPKTLRQFADGTDQTKRQLFQQYDRMAQEASGAGVVVDMLPVANMLRGIQADPGIRTVASGLIPGLEAMAANFEREGYMRPSEVQNVIETVNHQLRGYYNGSGDDFVKAVRLAPVAAQLRKQLDEAVMSAAGPGYQALRMQYGALRSVEDDIARAVQREANRKYPGLLGEFADTAASAEMLRGVLLLHPESVLRAGTIKAAQKWVRHINSPNRAIERMFARRIATETPPSTMRQFTGSLFDRSAAGAGAEAGYQGDRGPNGGRVLFQSSVPTGQ